MAEIKTGIFAKNVQKRLSRAQEKVRRSGSVTGGHRLCTAGSLTPSVCLPSGQRCCGVRGGAVQRSGGARRTSSRPIPPASLDLAASTAHIRNH